MSLEQDVSKIQEDMFKPASKEEVKQRYKTGWKLMTEPDKIDQLSDEMFTWVEEAVSKIRDAFPEATQEELRAAFDIVADDIMQGILHR
jgi:hypothetical protein